MREDLPSGELQDLRPALGDGKVPIGWARSINQACTKWLLKRGLLGAAAQHCLIPSPTARPEDEEEAEIAPANVKVNGLSFSFRRRRIGPGAATSMPADSGAGTGASDPGEGILQGDGGR
jgi:hypothetical protein